MSYQPVETCSCITFFHFYGCSVASLIIYVCLYFQALREAKKIGVTGMVKLEKFENLWAKNNPFIKVSYLVIVVKGNFVYVK